MKDDLKIIKKYYGENMMHLCRELFPTILEKTSVLSGILLEHFNPSRFLYEDVTASDTVRDQFKDYIYSFVDNDTEKLVDSELTVSELMNKAGYKIYQCHSEDDIQRFKEFYKNDEMLCTFFGNRLNSCHVFFAVKNDVDDIKREDFLNPSREDLYGTSVVSIQFSRGFVNTLSIKNRYNHSVRNPDATFSNNLENIIPGLTKAFENEYGFNINIGNKRYFNLNNYVLANDGKWYKYNYEINNVYYCPDNIVIDNFDVIKYDCSRYIVMDYFIIDLKEKKIELYDDKLVESFGEYNIDKISVSVNRNELSRCLSIDTSDGEIEIIIDKYNRMVSYKNEYLNVIGDNFLSNNMYLRKMILPNVEVINNDFLSYNEDLEMIYVPRLEKIGNDFLMHNKKLSNIFMPNLRYVRDDFLRFNMLTSLVYMPRLERVGGNFMASNEMIEELILPNLNKVDENFLMYNEKLSKIFMPNLEKVSNCFLYYNKKLEVLYMPNLENVGYNFLYFNEIVNNIYMPKLRYVFGYFLYNNKELTELDLPSLNVVRDDFLKMNQKISYVFMPVLREIGDGFLQRNLELTKLELPMVRSIGSYFMYDNIKLRCIDMPMLDNYPSCCRPLFSNVYMSNELIKFVNSRKNEEKNNEIIDDDNNDNDIGCIKGFKRRILRR